MFLFAFWFDPPGFDVQPTVHHSLAVLPRRQAALRGHLHSLWRAATAGRRTAAPADAVEPPPRLGPDRQWKMVAGIVIRDLARAEAIAAVQAHAALKIDAAEHALNRIVADCAKLITADAPKLRSARRPMHQPETQRPLAA